MSRIIVKNIPKEITEYDLQEYFSKKGEVTDVKIIKTDKGKSRLFAFIGFKNEEHGKDTIKHFNNSYLKTNKIIVEEALVQGDKALGKPWSKHTKSSEVSVVKKDIKEKIKTLKEIEKVASTKFKFDKFQGLELNENNNSSKIDNNNNNDSNNNNLDEYDPKRLYLRNLSFQATEEELESKFSKFGKLTEVSLPRDKHKNSFGYGFISYETVESAILAIEAFDKKVYQGRVLHITPAKIKDLNNPSLKLKDLTSTQLKNQKTSFKKEKLMKIKEEYDNQQTWNFLFINSNAVVEAVSKLTNIEKNEILNKDNAHLAVEMSKMETKMIEQTKKWLESKGIDIKLFNSKRLTCIRSKTTLLIKNIAESANEEEMNKVFSRYGELIQFSLAPMNTMGIAEFIDANNALNCFKNLSFYEFNDLPLYLEFAPIGVNMKKDETKKEEKKDADIDFEDGNVIFINNLSFDTKEEGLRQFFIDCGYNPSNVKIIKNKLKNNTNLSAGYGFVEFSTSTEADSLLRKLKNPILDNHSLKLTKAKTKISNDKMLGKKRKSDTELADTELEDFQLARDDKLLVKNIAFEANKEELRELFKGFGDVKNLRLPLKTSGEHRGYAFVEFLTYEEAKSAFIKLSNTHFYGRKLVIEWAKKDKTVEDIRNETQKKLETMNVVTHRKQGKKTIVV